MDFLATSEGQLLVGVAVGLVAVGAAYFLFSSKKPKDLENFKEFKPVKNTQLSHNVAKFRFDLPTPTSVLGLPIGQNISCRRQGILNLDGYFDCFSQHKGQLRAFGMIAGGSSYWVYGFLLQDEIDGVSKNYSDQFRVYYLLNQPPEVWNGSQVQPSN